MITNPNSLSNNPHMNLIQSDTNYVIGNNSDMETVIVDSPKFQVKTFKNHLIFNFFKFFAKNHLTENK